MIPQIPFHLLIKLWVARHIPPVMGMLWVVAVLFMLEVLTWFTGVDLQALKVITGFLFAPFFLLFLWIHLD